MCLKYFTCSRFFNSGVPIFSLGAEVLKTYFLVKKLDRFGLYKIWYKENVRSGLWYNDEKILNMKEGADVYFLLK